MQPFADPNDSYSYENWMNETAAQEEAPDWIEKAVRDVAELPDRNSPADWPEAMLVTGDELREILKNAVTDGYRLQPLSEFDAMQRVLDENDRMRQELADIGMAHMRHNTGGER